MTESRPEESPDSGESRSQQEASAGQKGAKGAKGAKGSTGAKSVKTGKAASGEQGGKAPSGAQARKPTKARKPASEPGSFDRIPAGRVSPRRLQSADTDMQGKQALFSRASQPPPIGSAAIECTRCNRRSVVTLVRLARLSLPGVHVPSTGAGHRALLKCPACDQRSWVRVTLR